MSTRIGKKRSGTTKLDLKLNLLPPRPNTSQEMETSPKESINSSWEYQEAISMESSTCVSSSEAHEQAESISNGSERAISSSSMVLVGCPRCLMYVMLSQVNNPKCPRCQSTVLLDFLKDQAMMIDSKKATS